MITIRTFSSSAKLAKFLRGELVAQGTVTTAFSATNELIDTAATFETAEVAVGDVVYVSGLNSGANVSLESTVATRDSETKVSLADSFTADIGAAYRICRGKITTTDIVNISFESSSNSWVLIYEADPNFIDA